ncbi:hypothetical protein J7E97_21945 [Streptomyces sp. ISL-66]|uniref:hypothetical protein n=1 Tax=Streptomyces sp. ISL-66 TaxID=2819186 RepID=UPI001BE7DAEA|nr:hypothetical protein [Streptomyces sp. ISL-66]MBT2470464.1 hypothetical protein [Streptomyces sp. ISL-66]
MGSGPAPRRVSAAAATTALLAAALLGCGSGPGAGPDSGSGSGPGSGLSRSPGPGKPSASAPAPGPTPPQRLCADLITHWAGVILDAGDDPDAVHLDYQSMGLSGGQNDILLAVLAGARAEERAGGPAAAREFTAREAGQRCAERYRSGTPSGGPWQ